MTMRNSDRNRFFDSDGRKKLKSILILFKVNESFRLDLKSLDLIYNGQKPIKIIVLKLNCKFLNTFFLD